MLFILSATNFSTHQRIQIIHSSKHVRVEIDGVEVANSSKPLLLYETGLPLRYYLPITHARVDLFSDSQLVTSCPYKVRCPFTLGLLSANSGADDNP
jgi:uncharacterized protein (DUF427 family)